MRGLACVAVLAVAACEIPANNPPAPPAPVQQPAAAQPARPPMIAGGYAAADANDAGVKAAEALVIAEIYKREPQRGIAETVTREVQVVAGLNYRFNVKMTGVNAYRVVVYKPLQGEMQVTSFEKTGGN